LRHRDLYFHAKEAAARRGKMGNRKFSGFVSVVLAQFVAMTMLVIGARAASTTTVVHAFSGGADGEYLDTDLVMDNAGNLYGTTVQGGSVSLATGHD